MYPWFRAVHAPFSTSVLNLPWDACLISSSFTLCGSTDWKTEGVSAFKICSSESCANVLCPRAPLSTVVYRSLLPFICLIRRFFNQNTIWNFSGRDRFSPGFSVTSSPTPPRFAASVKDSSWNRKKPHLWVSFLKYCKISDVKQWDTNYSVNC